MLTAGARTRKALASQGLWTTPHLAALAGEDRAALSGRPRKANAASRKSCCIRASNKACCINATPARASTSVARVQRVRTGARGLFVVPVALALETTKAQALEIVLGESLRVA